MCAHPLDAIPLEDIVLRLLKGGPNHAQPVCHIPGLLQREDVVWDENKTMCG